MADHGDTEPVGTVAAEAALTARYEQLRQVALAGQAEGWRHGLGVLATRGMTGWMNVCRTVTPSPAPPPAPAAPSARDTVDALGPDAGELVAVMAAMALAHT